MRRVKIQKAWVHEDQTFDADTLLEVDDDTAKMLVEDGYGTLATEETVVKQIDSEPANKTTNDSPTDVVTINRADYDAMIARIAGNDEPKPENKDKKAMGGRPTITRVHNRLEDDPLRGYKKVDDGGFGDFLYDVILASADGGRINDRLHACKRATKAVGSDEYASVEESIGGWWIPPAHEPGLLEKGLEEDWVRGNGARTLPVPGQMLTINAVTDETRTSTLYGGMQAYWLKERGQMTGTRGEYQQIELKPKALTALTYITDAMLHYAPALGAYVGGQFRDVLLYKQLDAFVNGTGAGEPLGVLNANCGISVAKETGQAAATIVTENILKMRSHMRPQEYNKAVWIASLSCMEQLNTLTIDVGTGGAPIALVNVRNDGIERILGRPLIYTEFCQTVGTVGDIMCLCWPTYLIGEGTYATSDSSIHVRFDYNETAFRFVMQCDGQPWWRTNLTLKNSWTVSPIVKLATRA